MKINMKERSFKILFATILCLASGSDMNEESNTAKELLEQVLRIPNPERVLNSVLGRLEKNKHDRLLAAAQDEELDCPDPPEIYPEYTEPLMENRERGLRQIAVQKHYPICHVERKIRRLSNDEYEYKPAYYEQVECVRPFQDSAQATSNEICSSLGFSCVQWNKTIHLTRRRYDSDCWETKTMVISAGCECMWPAHKLGDIKLHV